MKSTGVFFGILILFSSCVKVLELDIPEHEPALVVAGLMKDSIVEVYVGQSFPEAPSGYNGLPDCEVTISGPDLPITTFRSIPKTGYYNVPLALLKDKSYRLEVSHPNFLPVSSEEVHVDKPEILEFELDTLGGLDSIFPGYYLQLFELSTALAFPDSDFGGILIDVYIALKDDLGRFQIIQPGTVSLPNNVRYENFRDQRVIFLEKETLKQINGKLNMVFSVEIPEELQMEGRAYLQVSTISNSYKNFLQSYYTHDRIDLETFFAEPQYLFSNITNGHGYFGSQSTDTLSKTIR
ncbi:MAG: DUF4249 family protein [Saprospiraceae bacterium]